MSAAAAIMHRRYLAQVLIDALRRGGLSWAPVYAEPVEYHAPASSAAFRIVGAGRAGGPEPDGFVLRMRVSAALIPSPCGPEPFRAQHITLFEEDLLRALARLKAEDPHLWCGCHGFQDARLWDRAAPAPAFSCAYEELLSTPYQLYLWEAERLRRNHRNVSEDALRVAHALLDAARVIQLA